MISGFVDGARPQRGLYLGLDLGLDLGLYYPLARQGPSRPAAGRWEAHAARRAHVDPKFPPQTRVPSNGNAIPIATSAPKKQVFKKQNG